MKLTDRAIKHFFCLFYSLLGAYVLGVVIASFTGASPLIDDLLAFTLRGLTEVLPPMIALLIIHDYVSLHQEYWK
jgi:uncharacterized membrane protein